MCEHFVRKLNLNLYERHDAPMAKSDTGNRDFIAEFGFALFVELRSPLSSGLTQQEIRETAQQAAHRRIELLSGPHQIPQSLNADQLREVGEIAKRLNAYFSASQPNIVFRPTFPGCGFIDRSEGDVLYGNVLYEVKTVSRGFRGSDIRQLVTYCALNALSGEKNIESIGLYNPRSGTFFLAPIDLVSREISGKSYSDLFEDIHQAISGAGISR